MFRRLLSLSIVLFVSSCATGNPRPDDAPTTAEPADSTPPPPEVECDMWEVTEAVGRATPAFQNCYPKAVDENPSLKDRGTIEILLQWHVRDDGTTAHPSIVRSNTEAPFLHDCLERQADKLQLPDLADRACVARHGFRFSPDDGGD